MLTPAQIRELPLAHLPSTAVVPPSDGPRPWNACQRRLSPLACPHYCLPVLCSLARILVLCPHSSPRWPGELACLLSGDPRRETAWTASGTMESFTPLLHFFPPLLIITVTVLGAPPKRRLIRPHQRVSC